MFKTIVDIVIPVKSFLRSHPNGTFGICKEKRDDVAADGCRVICLMKIIRKPIAIVFVQAILRSYPDIAYFILTDTGNLVTRQFVGSIEMYRLS